MSARLHELTQIAGVGADDLLYVADGATNASYRATQAQVLSGQASIYNVLAHGVVADGSTDNKTAIDALITAAAATGGVIYFPPAPLSYRTTGGHNLPENVGVVGAHPTCTTIEHRGVGTYCFRVGSTTAGPDVENTRGFIKNLEILGQSSGDGSGGFGAQVGVYVLNAHHVHLENVHCQTIHKAFYFDGGDEGALGANTFLGHSRFAFLTCSNCWYGFHVYRWVTGGLFEHLYGYGNSPVAASSVGLWIDQKTSTSTFLQCQMEGFSLGYKIDTSREGLCFINPRVEGCTTEWDWLSNTFGHVIIGGNHTQELIPEGTKIGQNTQLHRSGFFPPVAAFPTAASAYRHAILRYAGASGVADMIAVCQKDAANAYSWQPFDRLLAYKRYMPASPTNLDSGASDNTFQDVDAANLVVTFTAPPSGAVLVRLTGLGTRVDTTATKIYWGLRDGSGYVAGTGGKVVDSTGVMFSISQAFTVTGLTPGTSYTWKWAHRPRESGATAKARLAVGGDPSSTGTDANGPAVMEVWAA